MGQPITVVLSPGATPVVRMFSLDRSLTGMAIERYGSVDVIRGNRPSDVLARRLFDLGATYVTVYSNVVTVTAPESSWADLEAAATSTIEHLFEYYGEQAGWSPVALVDPRVNCCDVVGCVHATFSVGGVGQG